MKTAGKIFYVLLGIVLAVSTIGTAPRGLSQVNKEIYKKAEAYQPQIDELGFSGFQLKDYKVRFYDGKNDYVTSNGKYKKEKPVFNTFVGTTYKVDKEYQVILPTLEQFSNLFDLLGAAEGISEGNISFKKSDYSKDEHVATLWHEATHAYQMTHYEKQITTLMDNFLTNSGLLASNNSSDDSSESASADFMEKTVSSVDSNKTVVKLYKKQITLLKKAYHATDIAEKQSLVSQYLDLQKERADCMTGSQLALENYYECVEGTARYVEAHIYTAEKGQKASDMQYVDDFSYNNGSGKYYTAGMIKCCLLDSFLPQWKEDFQYTVSLDELLAKGINGNGL